MLGSGAFGEVTVRDHRESGTQRTDKVLRKARMDEKEKFNLISGMKIFESLDRTNILKPIGTASDTQYVYIFADICKGGKHFEEIVTREKFSELDGSMHTRQILSCITYCH